MSLVELPDVVKILGGKKVLRKKIRNDLDVIELSDLGLPKTALINLANYLCLSLSQVAQLLPVSERTIQRYSPTERFNRVVSEQILHIAEVAAKGVGVFEEKENFLLWLHQPNVALSNEAPINLLKSRFGADMVLEELGRMEYGVFS